MFTRLVIVPTLLLIASGFAFAEDAPPAPVPPPGVPPSTSGTPDDTLTVTATTQPADAWTPPPSSSSTRFALEPLENPQTVNVVTDDALRARGVTSARRASDYVPGIQVSGGYNGIDDGGVISRGFSSDEGILRDGFREWVKLGRLDLATVDHIEYLKGPSSLAAGSVAPGGSVNYVMKKPQPTSMTSLDVIGRSDGTLRTIGDETGSLSSDGSWQQRLIIAGGREGNQVDYVKSDSLVVSPSLAWHPSDRLEISGSATFQTDDVTPTLGLPEDARSFNVDPDFFPGEPGDFHRTQMWTFRLGLGYRVAQDIRLRQEFSMQRSKEHNQRTFTDAFIDDTTISRFYSAYFDESSNNYGSKTELVVERPILDMPNRFAAAVDLAYGSFAYQGRNGDLAPISTVNPSYGSTSINVATDPASVGYNQRGFGVLLTDYFTPVHWLSVLGGMRFDSVRVHNDETYTVNPAANDDTVHAVSPVAGIVVSPMDGMSVYASYATSYAANQFSYASNGSLLDPSTAEQWECGIKNTTPDGMFLSQLAVYQITRRNYAVPDPADPNYSIAAGVVRSRGVEWEGIGSLAPGLKLNAFAAFMASEVVEDTSLPIGDRLALAPCASGGLRGEYTQQTGTLAGFGGSLGVRSRSPMDVSLPNTVRVATFTTVEIGIHYRRGWIEGRIGIDNVLDEVGWTHNGYGIVAEPGRSFSSSLTATF